MTPTPLRPTRLSLEELRETYDAVVAAGSQRAVAKANGWHQAKVKHRVETYMRHVGIPWPPPGIISRDHSARASLSHSGLGERSAYVRSQARVRQLEAEVAELQERVEKLQDVAGMFGRVHAKLDAIARTVEARKPEPVSHRRLADGGKRRAA